MPQIGTQLDAYSASLEKKRREITAERALSEQTKYETAELITKKKQLIPDMLRITLGFCQGSKSGQMTRPFIAWYDMALRCRVVPHIEGRSFVLVPWQEFKDAEYIVEQYACKTNLREALVVYIQSLGEYRYEAALLHLLQTVNLGKHLNNRVSADRLRDYVAAHSMFHPVI